MVRHFVRLLLALLVVTTSTVALLGQTQDSYDYNSEFTWGINKNSFGGLIGGFTFKKARRLNTRVFETYGLELMNVKNPHEVRVQAGGGSYFIYGKTNYLYAIRLQYGRDIVLFTKGPQQGVEVKAVFAAGPTMGIVNPYYVQVSKGSINSTSEPYTNQNFSSIIGTGSLFEGMGEARIEMGGNFKAALNFELGTLKSNVTGFEAGFLLDAYFNKIPLMAPTTENFAVYPTVFLTLFYGSRK